MCNNFALVTKEGDFNKHVLETKLSLVLGRSKGSKGTGVMHNGRRVRSHDRIVRSKLADKLPNHDSLNFIESLFFYEKTSDFSFKAPKDYHVFMGHNRAPSSGMGAGEKFVHPFEYGEPHIVKRKDKEVTLLKDRLWFQHNGTIKDPELLAESYGLDFKDYENDSYLLGSLIYAGVDPAEIFLKYRGYCTCIWYWEKTNTLHIFKGGTLVVNGKVQAERDLYMVKTKNFVMFNTQENILNVIQDFDNQHEIEDVPVNKIMTIDKNIKVTYQDVDRKFVPPPKPKKAKKVYTTPTYTSTSTTKIPAKGELPRFPDDRNAFNQMVWFSGLYYFNYRIAHGVYKLDDIGRVDDVGKEYYFWNGRMVRSQERFQDKVQGKPWNPNWLHSKAMHTCGDSKVFYTGKGKAENKNNPILFYNYDFKVRKGILFSAGEVPKNGRPYIRTPLPKPNEHVWLENYNTYCGTDFKAFHLVKTHYETKMDITSIYGTNNNEYRIDFINICEDVRLMLEDPICEMYNELNQTQWLTRFQCQQDFFKKNDVKNPFNRDVGDFYLSLNDYLITLTPEELYNNLV